MDLHRWLDICRFFAPLLCWRLNFNPRKHCHVYRISVIWPLGEFVFAWISSRAFLSPIRQHFSISEITNQVYFNIQGDSKILVQTPETPYTKMKKVHMNICPIIHLFSSDRERYLWSLKCFSEATVCLCVPFIWRFLNFFGKFSLSFPIFCVNCT